jgi:hypothetical protein
MQVAGGPGSGYLLRASGVIQTIRWKVDTTGGNCSIGECGDATTMADSEVGAFGGNTQDLADAGGASNPLAGVWEFTDAQYHGPPQLDGDPPNASWIVDVGNPHLDMDGDPIVGAYSAFLGPPMLAELGLTPSEAASAGLLVRRHDGATVTTIGAAIMPFGGGVYFRIPSLPYSTPQLRIRAAAGRQLVLDPDAPVQVRAVALDGGAVVTFDRPFFDGGARIQGYRVRCIAGDAVATAFAPRAMDVEVPGLQNDVEYACRVRAQTTRLGDASLPALVTPQLGLPDVAPGAPRSLHVQLERDNDLAVAWGTPASTGGSPITRYRVDICRIADPCPADSLLTRTPMQRSVTIARAALTSGRRRILVRARNAVGLGDPISTTIRILG